MKKLSGYVLVLETNSGVPNVLVTAFDSEQSIQEITANYNKKRFSLTALGKRIGSVLTDENGKFMLTAEDLEFEGNELRPDLLVVVFAPEDIKKIDEPFPAPPEERILYISTVARTDAGAEEAFLIRLLQAQLDKFDIMASASAIRSETDSNRLVSAIESAWSFQDNLRDKLRARLQDEHDKFDQLIKLGEENVKNLSAIPLHLRDNQLRDNNFLINGKSDLKTSLKSKQEDAINDGITRLAKTERTMRLSLTRKDLDDLELTVTGETVTGAVNSEKLAEKIRSLMNGVDLVRVRERDNPSHDELERKYLTEPTATTPIN
jgi:dsDNA-binding SOS-regulon protein